MIDLGALTFFIVLEVQRKAFCIHVTQTKYAIDVLKRFDMANVNSCVTPCSVGSLHCDSPLCFVEDTKSYQSTKKKVLLIYDWSSTLSHLYSS